MIPPAEARPGPLAPALRWIGAGAVVLAVHAGVLALVVQRPTPSPLATGAPDAIAIDLEPVEGLDAKTPMDAPAPEAADEPQAAAAPAAAAAGLPSTPEVAPPDVPVPPTPDPTPPPPTAPPPSAPPPPPDPAPDALEAPPPAPAAAPAAPIEPPPPPTERPTPPVEAPPPRPVPASTAAVGADAAEERAPAARRAMSGAEAAWRGKLVAHLNRFRRFPPGIAGGTARIGFALDRQGRVVNLQIVGSSGDAALDAAARAIVARASPFPAPPAETDGAALSFVVPVHFGGQR